MTDDINVTPVVVAGITGGVLGTARAFARIQSANSKESLRSNTTIGTSSPSVLRIAHQMPSGKNTVQRSLASLDQTLARVDSGSVITRIDNLKVGVTVTKDLYTTEQEVVDAFLLLAGQLLAGSGAGLRALIQGQQ